MKDFKGKTALVTGASSGIGLALATSLANRGAHLIITARSEDKLNDLAADLRKKGNNVQVFTNDLSQPGAAQALFEQVEKAGLQVDLLVNNAGFGKWGEFLDVDWPKYNEMLQLNISALTQLCHLFIPSMLKRGDCGIINLGSIASFVPLPYAAVYGATKAYILIFTEALQGEYGARGVQCMTLCPGFTDTNFATVANPAVKLAPNSQDTAEIVAEAGLDAFIKGELYIVPGKAPNKQVAFLPRLLPRKSVLKIVRDNWRKTMEMS